MELLTDIFSFAENVPMIFTNVEFWIFFAVVMAIFSIIHPYRALRNAFLFLASLFFYYKTGGFFFVLLLFSTVADYLIGFAIHNARGKPGRLLWLVTSIVVNLLVLGYFKYSYFFTGAFNDAFGTNVEYYNHFNAAVNDLTGSFLRVDYLLPPVGISFFTFQTISYAVDVYKGKIEPVKSILDFGFYVSFFPQLVAGPIVRAAEFIPQIYQPYRLSKDEFGEAIWWILKGLLKKLILADYIAVNFVDRVFSDPGAYSGFENVMGLYGYSLQVYADFSGYTDVAIGVALLMGFRLPINFNSPYKARSVGGFWKRWHISLSTWLKDYLYIPMGGSRRGGFMTWLFYAGLPFIVWAYFGWDAWLEVLIGTVVLGATLLGLALKYPKIKKEITTSSNLMITMVLGGFWHGSSWLFVIWGGLNGLGLVIYKIWRKVSPWEGRREWIWQAWTVFLTFNFITFTRIWFRSQNLEDVDEWFHQVWYNFGWEMVPSMIQSYQYVFYMIYAGMVIHWLPSAWKEQMRQMFIRSHVAVKVVATVVVVFVVYQAMSSDLQPFIYFQF